jgi:peptidoglycan L-alanyl-D-glutamate endopeptidase CwlK
MPNRDLNDLHPDLLPLAKQFLDKCKDAGLDILVTCTYRSPEEQAADYTIGRTVSLGRRPITNAQPGQSDHNFTIDGKPASKAFDIVPMVNGECDWNENSSTWNDVAKVWRSGIGNSNFWLDWYGKPGAPFHEMPHFCLKERF